MTEELVLTTGLVVVGMGFVVFAVLFILAFIGTVCAGVAPPQPLTQEEKRALLWMLALGILGTLVYVYWDVVLEGLKLAAVFGGIGLFLWGQGFGEDDEKCPMKKEKPLVFPGGFYISPPPPSGS